MTVTILIFSCNRALQLQTLLNSLYRHLTVDGSYAIHVLYRASTVDYQKGYDLLIRSWPHVQFHLERSQREWAWPMPTGYWKNLYRYVRHKGLRRITDFKARTEQIIDNSASDGVMFLTDDSLFTRPVRIDANRLAALLADSTFGHSFSLRLGLTLQPIPDTILAYGTGGYVWQVPHQPADLAHWTWRFSVDGHLYPKQSLLPILRRLHYANPNSLEGFVNEYIRNVRPDLFNKLLFDAQPSLVGFALNKVQTHNANRSGNIAPALLNDKLLAGYRLSYQYQERARDFQPALEAILLLNSSTGEQEHIWIAAQ